MRSIPSSIALLPCVALAACSGDDAGAGGASSSSASVSASSTGSTGSTASTSGAGGGAVCPPGPTFEGGAPLATPDHQWTWVDIPGAKCRDGSPTGIGVRLSSKSDKVFVYLEGGGACFNAATCAVSLASFGKASFDAWAASVGQTGIFDTTFAANPVADWNAIYVPYCTGDVHAGSAENVSVPGGPTGQQFVGYENMALYLARIVPTFKATASQVLVTGVSAGGFGAAFNYDRIATAFCPTPVALLDDSGPPMADAYLAPCLQSEWRSLWNLAAALPADCPACTGPDGGGIVHYADYLGTKWPSANLGLLSSTADSVISTFYGYGSNDCMSQTPLSGATYQAGLDDLRQNHLSHGHWGTYYVPSVTHTYLLGPGFFTTSVNATALTDWFFALLHGTAGNVGP